MSKSAVVGRYPTFCLKFSRVECDTIDTLKRLWGLARALLIAGVATTIRANRNISRNAQDSQSTLVLRGSKNAPKRTCKAQPLPTAAVPPLSGKMRDTAGLAKHALSIFPARVFRGLLGLSIGTVLLKRIQWARQERRRAWLPAQAQCVQHSPSKRLSSLQGFIPA